jgi:hypothetical protein
MVMRRPFSALAAIVGFAGAAVATTLTVTPTDISNVPTNVFNRSIPCPTSSTRP